MIWGLVGWHIGMSDAVEWFGGLEEAMESDFEDYVYLHSINNCSE